MNYQNSYAKLNSKQKLAVDTIDGPVMVIAGPGSGKTQLLSTRVGQILEKSGVDHKNILILTFTNSGVDAMKSRLVKFFGVQAHEIPVYTFHGLCNMIIATNSHIFGLKESQTADPIMQMEIIKEIIDNLPGGHVLVNPNAPYYYIQHILHLFGFMKNEIVTPETIDQKIDEYLSDLPNRPEFQYVKANKTKGILPGDPKTAMIEKESMDMEKISAAAKLLGPYQAKLIAKNAYDYDDMILMVIDALLSSEWLRRNFQEKWQYIMVDESQDTNGSQFSLLRLLLEFWGAQSNILLVGDDDQAIYEFQGARIENLTDFLREYPNASRIVLDKNYRSGSKIINAADNLINNNSMRLSNVMKIEKRMEAMGPKDDKVEILEFKTSMEELVWLVGFLKIQPDWSKIGIIFSKHRQGEDLMKLLDGQKIPYQSVRKTNVLTNKYVQNIITMLQYLSDPIENDHLLFQIINYTYTPVQYKTAIKCAMAIKKKEIDSYSEFLGNMNSKFMKFIEEALGVMNSQTFDDFVSFVIHGSGLTNHLLAISDRLSIEAVKTFIEYIKSYSEANEQANIVDLMFTFETMIDNNYYLSKEIYFGNENGVSIMTSHGAKGLEFETVFMIDCSTTWEPGRRSGKFKFPDNMTSGNSDNELESSRRAFFVAMTRAKKNLYLSYHTQLPTGKEKQRSRFIDELLDGHDLDVTPMADIDVKEIDVIDSVTPHSFQKHLMAETDIKTIVDSFVWSASALNTFLRCPMSFYFDYIMRISKPTNIALVYGTSIHDAIYLKTMDHQKGLEQLSIVGLQDQFSNILKTKYPQQFKLLNEKGRTALGEFYTQTLNYKIPGIVYAEKKLKANIEGIPCQGFVDAIEKFDVGQFSYIDYKTGKYTGTKFREQSDYENQANFYLLLGSNYSYENLFPVSVEFLFVDNNKNHVIERDSNKLHDFTQSLVKSDASIKNLEFSQRCDDPQCYWCNYIKSV